MTEKTDANEKKGCPMAYSAPTELLNTNCCKEECAWWVPGDPGCCVVLSIGASLYRLRAYGIRIDTESK